MFFKSLQWRLVSFFCLIAMFLVMPIGLYLNMRVEDWYYEDFKRGIDNGFVEWTLDLNGDVTAEWIYNDLRQGGNASLFYIIGDNKSYTVVDRKDNENIHSSDKNFDINNKSMFLVELFDSENFIRALNGEDGGIKKLEQYGDRAFFDYAKPLGDYVIYFRYYKDEWKPVINSFSNIILTSLLIAFTVAFILGYILSKTVTLPIVRLMNKAKGIAAGDFGKMLEVESDDEIGKLTDTFNYMSKNLKVTLAQISSEKNKMETILNYLTDGVIAFDVNGRVIHMNPACRQMLEQSGHDLSFNDYTAKYGIDVTIEDIIYLNPLKSREMKVEANGTITRVYFAAFTDELGAPGGVIAVLQDITEQQKLDDMRKEFVANVSHELRTPITSIKSYAETLLDGVLDDRDTAERFLKVINSEADSMTRLVRDLLQLSKFDNRQMQLKLEPVHLDELVKASVEKIEFEAESKGQTIERYVIGETPVIKADYGRLEQVMLNVLSNAIKYTPEGGRIFVYISRMFNDAYVKITDTGVGIPEKDIPRIFERFYRVDKARSREMGGTGLGLAIAKEIIEEHSGSISIKSEMDKGTEVTIKLPVKDVIQS